MAQLTELSPTEVLELSDESFLRQGDSDKRINLHLAGVLSWAIRNGYAYLGSHNTSRIFIDENSFTMFNGKVFFVKDGVTFPYQSGFSNPNNDVNLEIRTDASGSGGGGIVDTDYVAVDVAGLESGTTINGNSVSLEVGQQWSTGGTVWRITNDANDLPVANSLYAKPVTDIFFDDFTGDDAGIEIRKVITMIENGGITRKITGTGRTNLLKSTVTEGGKTCGIVIQKANLVQFDGARLRFTVDHETPEMAAIDYVLNVAPANSTDSSYLNWKRLRLDGGAWTSKNDRPESIVYAKEFALRYIRMDDCEFRRSRGHNVDMVAFVGVLTKVRGSFAGDNHNNFNFEVADNSGDSAARTGYKLTGCSADYAGMHSFSFTGANGHTYCHLDNCHADYWGRDEAGDTIAANLQTASAYHFENVRVIKGTALGAEKGGRLISGENCRAIDIDGIYGLLCGDSAGVTDVNQAMYFEGYCEDVKIKGFSNRSPKSTFTKRLSIVSPNAVHSSCFTLDKTVPLDKVDFVSGLKSTTSTSLVLSPEHQYVEGMIKGAGEAVVTGLPLLGNNDASWFNQSFYTAEQTFHYATADVGKIVQVAELTSPTEDGYMGFTVEATVGKMTGTTPEAPVKFVGSAARAQAAYDVSGFSAINTNAEITPPVLSWNGNFLEVTVNDPFAAVYLKITATGRKSLGEQTFQWRSL